MRTLNYTYTKMNHDYKGYNTLIFETDFSAFTNSSDNEIYNVNIWGTTNLTTLSGSPAFASKTNYYEISSLVSGSLPVIVD